jgi:glycosyltransferase involved in cell wall biosynthesis
MSGEPPKIRVAVVSPFVDKRHGTERCLAEQLERLAKHYEIHLFSSRVEDLDLSRIALHRVPEIPGPHLVKYLWWFAANHVCRWSERRRSGRPFDLVYSPGINCLDADVIHVHVVFGEFYRHVRGRMRFLDNPLSSWLRLAHRRTYYRFLIALEKRIYTRNQTVLIGISRKTQHDLERLYGRGTELPMAFHGIDARVFDPRRRLALRAQARESLGLPPAAFVVLLVGNDWRRKGLDCLLTAMRKLARPELRLLIRGQDDPTPYQHFLSGPNALPVQVVPSREDMEFYYAAAEVCAAPSLEDTYSLPPLEAMASGLPVIVSRNAGVSEIVTPGFDALVLEDPTDADELARLILRLLDDEPYRARLADNAVKTAQKFTWEANAAAVKRVFDCTLERKRGPS